MIKTNSKQARANIRQYIRDNFNGTNYDIEAPEDFGKLAGIILDTFRQEKRYDNYRGTEAELFEDWASGLPSILDTCYYYNRSAIDDLAGILEQTPAEAEKYSESDAEKMLSKLIYRELINA